MAQETKSASRKRDNPQAPLSADQVIAYLVAHPDFLTCHPELLKTLTPPSRWRGDSVVDMQSYMVDTLKGEMEGLRSCAQEVIETSRSNMANQSRTHAAVLSLLAAADMERLSRMISDDLPVVLDVDVAVVGIEWPELPQGLDDIRPLKSGDVDRLVGTNQEAALLATMDGDLTDDGAVFGNAAALVKSAALARMMVDPPGATGLLALGSRHERAFHGGQGTELLRFLARVIERCLARLITFPS